MAWPIIQIASLLYGAYRYFKKPKIKESGYKGGSVEVRATTNTPVPVCYGNCEVTGNIIYKEDTTSATNQLAVGLCEGPIQSIDSVTVNGIAIPVYPTAYEGCSYTPYYGTPSQTADSRFSTSLMRVTCCENNFVDEADPTTVQNYYSTDRLFVEDNSATGNEKYTYLKFDVSGLNLAASSDISAATLRLTIQSNSATANHTLYIYEMADDSWAESTITWNNKPSFGDQISTLVGSLIVAANSIYCDIDITQWVKDTYDYDASKIVGIGLRLETASSGAGQTIIASRDSAGAPELRIAYAPKELAAFAHTAYIAMTIKDSELFKGHLNDIKVRLHGREIYDGDINPNYSTNPAWCVYDQLTNARYGADIPSSLINAASFTAVASYCDASITNADGVSETRFRCDAVFDDKDTVESRINDILASFGGYLFMLDGKLNLGVDSAASSSHTFTVDNIVDGSFSYWLIDKSQQPNDISVMYYDAANDFKASYVNVKDQTLIDTYGRNFEEIQLRCVNRYSQAARMAKYYLNKSVYSQYGCSFKVSINNCDVSPGDVCAITHAVAGWTSETFRITSVQEDDNDEIVVTCEEYDAALYSDDGLPYTPPEGGSLPNVNEVPPVITNLALTESHAQGDDGTYIPQIKVTWTEPDYIFPLNYIVWYKAHAAADYIFWELSTDNLAYINTDGAGQYDVVVQTVNILTGLKTDFGTSPNDTITLAGKTTPPADVSFNDINCTFYKQVYIEWLPVTDTDLAYYELRTDTNWGNATNLVWQGKATAYTMMNPALTTYTFYIKARDLSDNYSANADSIALAKADPVLGAMTVDFTGRDCIVSWDHAYDEDFEKYKIEVYSDAARTVKVHTCYISSPPYIYAYEVNKSTNSGTAIRHPYFTVTVNNTLSQNDSQNCDGANAAPSAPAGLTVTPGMGKLFINWTALAENDIVSYNIYAKTTSPANTLVGNVAGTNYTFDPEGENTYYVTVAGVDAFGEGSKCSEETQTTNPYALTNYKLDVPLTRDINFSVGSSKAKWTTGTLYYEGSAYTIAAETTGTTDNFIYWDKDDPLKFNHSATAPALDDDIWVMAYFDGTEVYNAFAQKIIHGGLIQASSIQADKLSVAQLSAISADLGTITAGTVTGATVQTEATAAKGVKINTDGIKGYTAAGENSFFLDAADGSIDMRNVIAQTANVSPALYIIGHTSAPTATERVVTIRDNEDVAQIEFYDQGKITTTGNIIQAASTYHNFGGTEGTSGYGFKDNSGTMQYKNSGGAWTNISAGAGTPGGSDTQVQFNDGGSSFGGDAGFVYDKTNNRATINSIKAASANTFTTSTTDAYQDGLLLKATQDVGQNNLGASIAFAKHGGDTRHCAIVAKQTGSDSDQMGFSIHTHPSTTGTDAMVEAVEIDHNGNIHLKNGATVFKEISVPLLSCKLRGTADPSLSQIANATGPTTGVYCYVFAYGVTKEIFGSIQIPQDYKAGASLYVHINRRLDATPDATTDEFRIGLEYTWCEEDGTMAATSTVESDYAVGANSDTKLIRTEIATISGSGHTAGSTLIFRLYREAIASGTETESGVWITSIDFEYESDRLGADATTV